MRPKDPLRETWDGFRYGPDLTESEFKIDKAMLSTQLAEHLPELLKTVEKVYYRLHYNKDFEHRLLNAMTSAKLSRGRSGLGMVAIHDPSELLGEMRVIKSKEEVEWLQTACDITVDATHQRDEIHPPRRYRTPNPGRDAFYVHDGKFSAGRLR